jgi:hypothetical protein
MCKFDLFCEKYHGRKVLVINGDSKENYFVNEIVSVADTNPYNIYIVTTPIPEYRENIFFLSCILDEPVTSGIIYDISKKCQEVVGKP